MAWTLIYLGFTFSAVFLPISKLREFLVAFGGYGVSLPEKSYADSCDFTLDNVVGSLDIFVFAHSIGWFFKMLVYRDFYFTLLNSALWELVEILFTHDLPNFAECWWDQWLLDVCLCNMIGILLGWVFIRVTNMRRYNWFATVFNRLDYYGNVINKRSSKKEIFLGGIVFVLGVFWNQWFELNSFYLKSLFWLPVSSPFNILRLTIWGLAGGTTITQVYRWAYDTTPTADIPITTTFGTYSYYSILLICLETWIYLSRFNIEFPNPIPENVVLYWYYILGAFTLISIIFLMKLYTHNGPKQSVVALPFSPTSPLKAKSGLEFPNVLEVSDIMPIGGKQQQTTSSVYVGMSPAVHSNANSAYTSPSVYSASAFASPLATNNPMNNPSPLYDAGTSHKVTGRRSTLIQATPSRSPSLTNAPRSRQPSMTREASRQRDPSTSRMLPPNNTTFNSTLRGRTFRK